MGQPSISPSAQAAAEPSMSEQRDEKRAEESSHHQADTGDGFSLSGDELGEVEEKRPPRAAVLHEVIRREGEQELSRTFTALSVSALAAGLSMGFSMLARGLLIATLATCRARSWSKAWAIRSVSSW